MLFMGKSTMSMAIFNSFLYVHQRVEKKMLKTEMMKTDPDVEISQLLTGICCPNKTGNSHSASQHPDFGDWDTWKILYPKCDFARGITTGDLSQAVFIRGHEQ